MRVLPMHQPWASLVALGVKEIETRKKPAPPAICGQRIAIHANLTREELNLCATDPFRRYLPDSVEDLPLGAIIATVHLVRSEQITEESAAQLQREHPDEFAFGDYTPGRFAWVLIGAAALDEPVPFKAHQGWNEIDGELVGFPEQQGALV